ncbi:MAG: hydroxymethylbilane synthase [Oligoflexales bacterium]|nr:hydroxymethylbilane synthase [Oligoflexales bacterium]
MSSNSFITIGSRGSALALWQANFVADLLKKLNIESKIKIIQTSGDKIQDRFLNEIGGKGLFIKELELALASGEVDVAIHSLKDVPVSLPEQFELAAVLPRHSASDLLLLHPKNKAFIAQNKNFLSAEFFKRHKNLRIATGSLRRQALLKACAAETITIPIRGNVDTRIQKLIASDWDALILAKASLDRLKIDTVPTCELDSSWFIPAPAQGALALESLKNSPFKKVFQKLECPDTRYAIEVERTVLRILGGDCTLPFSCYVSNKKDNLWTAKAAIFDLLGGESLAHFEWFDKQDAASIANRIIEILLNHGANQILKNLKLPPIELPS